MPTYKEQYFRLYELTISLGCLPLWTASSYGGQPGSLLIAMSYIIMLVNT